MFSETAHLQLLIIQKEKKLCKTFNSFAISSFSAPGCLSINSGGTQIAPAASEAILGKCRIEGNSFDTTVTP